MRLVDADMLIKTIPTEEINARMAIATAPTIEAEPKHGRWITEPIQTSARVPFPMERCSVCDRLSIERTNYCPNCGARMDEVRNE